MHSIFFLVLASVSLSFAFPDMRFSKRTELGPSNGTLVPSSCEWIYQGCYEEPVNGRICPAFVKDDVSLTVEKCLGYCHAANYAYALVEYGRWVYFVMFCVPSIQLTDSRECWCDKTANLSGGMWNGTGTGCRVACKGDAKEFCGGLSKWVMSDSPRLNLFLWADCRLKRQFIHAQPFC